MKIYLAKLKFLIQVKLFSWYQCHFKFVIPDHFRGKMLESKAEKYLYFIDTSKKQCYNISINKPVLLAETYSSPQKGTAMSS
jgi:hypothetical protein